MYFVFAPEVDNPIPATKADFISKHVWVVQDTLLIDSVAKHNVYSEYFSDLKY